MLTLMEVLSQPLFRDFKFLSDISGLYNVVTGIGIFEWETKDIIESNFHSGEFVITTLSCAKGNIDNAVEFLTTLIKQKVAAIAIKDIYFKEFPLDFISYANEKHTPILLFSSANFEDIVFNIKNALESDNLNSAMAKKVDLLLKFKGQSSGFTNLAKDINPFFNKNHICCYCVPKIGNDTDRQEDLAIVLDKFYNQYLQIPKNNISFGKAAYSLIKYSRGILLIYTDDKKGTNIRKELLSLMDNLKIKEEYFRIGISESCDNLSKLADSIWESIYACATCDMRMESLLDFGQIGINKFLCPLRHNTWIKKFYSNFEELLSEYDSNHNSNLLQTLLVYVKCDGNISLTADQLFQHSNTIRYRIDRIKDVLGLNQSNDFYNQLHIFATLHEIYKILDN